MLNCMWSSLMEFLILDLEDHSREIFCNLKVLLFKGYKKDYMLLSDIVKRSLIEHGKDRKLWVVCMGYMNPETYIFGQRHWKFEVETHDFLDKYILIGEMNNDNYIGCKRPDKIHLKVCPGYLLLK